MLDNLLDFLGFLDHLFAGNCLDNVSVVVRLGDDDLRTNFREFNNWPDVVDDDLAGFDVLGHFDSLGLLLLGLNIQLVNFNQVSFGDGS